MRDFPKRLATATDIRNCLELVREGVFEAQELLDAIAVLENRNYMDCPIREVGADKKTVTINYCAEAKSGIKAIVAGKTVTINAAAHEEGEPSETGEKQFEKTVLTLSAIVDVKAKEIKVTAPYTIYDELGMTEAEMEEIKEELING